MPPLLQCDLARKVAFEDIETYIVPGSHIDGLIRFKIMLHGISKTEYVRKKAVKHQLYCDPVKLSEPGPLASPSIFALPYFC
jgi:hypothetical protein